MAKLRSGSAILAAILILFSSTSCQAENSKYAFPESCVRSGFEFSDNDLILNTESGSGQSLYLFHNISEKEIWLNHPVTGDPGASAGWASEMASGRWSAFALNKEDFVMNCSAMGEGKVQYLTCEKVITACKFTKPIFIQAEGGSYWVSEDKMLEAVLEEVKNRGIGW